MNHQNIIKILKLQPGAYARGNFYVGIRGTDNAPELIAGANPRGNKLPNVVGFTSLELAVAARKTAEQQLGI